MELLFFAVLLTVLTIATLVGWTADSRDGADWQPTNNGMRAPAQR
jgi:hypothetical protein